MIDLHLLPLCTKFSEIATKLKNYDNSIIKLKIKGIFTVTQPGYWYGLIKVGHYVRVYQETWDYIINNLIIQLKIKGILTATQPGYWRGLIKFGHHVRVYQEIWDYIINN